MARSGEIYQTKDFPSGLYTSLRVSTPLCYARIDLIFLDDGCIRLVHYILIIWEEAVCDPVNLNMGVGG